MTKLTRVTVTCETADGVVATIVCEPEQSFGQPHGHPRLRIDREEVEADRFRTPGSRQFILPGDPVLEIVAGRVLVTAAGP